MALFDADSAEAKRLRLAVVSVRKGRRGWTHFIQETSIRSRLRRSKKIAAVLSHGAYDRLQSDVLLFDPVFAGIVAENAALFLNQRQLERALGFLEQAGPAARETIESITTHLRIKNIQSLLDAAGTDPNMIAKARGIQAKMQANPAYAQAMTMEKLLTFQESRPDLPIDIEDINGKPSFVFYSDAARRWRILKLLDDDYLHSELTQINYEANSKVALPG